MGKLMVVTGRGGAGKSTFVAVATKYLKLPKLLIDLDPDESLADMLGADWVKQGKKSISDVLSEIMAKGKRADRKHDVISQVLRPIIENDCLYRDPGFDLIRLGTKFTVGCYCAPDTELKELIPSLVEKYGVVLVDSPAGLEHFNRKVVTDIDDLFIILDPSDKAMKHTERVRSITRELKVNYYHLYLVGNHRFTREAEAYLLGAEESYLGKIDYDPEVKQYNLEGRSLLALPNNSPASCSVKRILAKAGYEN